MSNTLPKGWQDDGYAETTNKSYCTIYGDGGNPLVDSCDWNTDGVTPPPTTPPPGGGTPPPGGGTNPGMGTNPDNSGYPLIAWVAPVPGIYYECDIIYSCDEPMLCSGDGPGVHLELGSCVGYMPNKTEWEIISDGVTLTIVEITVSDTGIFMFNVLDGIEQGISVVTLSHLIAASGVEKFLDGRVLNEVL